MSWPQSSSSSQRHRRQPRGQSSSAALNTASAHQQRTTNDDGSRDYYDDSDEENAKSRKAHETYKGACSLGRFCLNPCLCLATTLRKRCCRTQAQQHQRQGMLPRTRRGSIQNECYRSASFTRASLLLLVLCAMLTRWPRRDHHHSFRHPNDWSLDQTPILIKLFDFSNVRDVGGWRYHASRRFHSVSQLQPLEGSATVDYGGLDVLSLSSTNSSTSYRRRIAPDDDVQYENYKRKLVREMNQRYLSSSYDHLDERLTTCRIPNFARLYFPTCNIFHELDVARDYNPHLQSDVLDLSYYDSYLFSHGYYRDAWMLKHPASNDTLQGGVLKTLRMKHEYRMQSMYEVQNDASVMERLTSSPRILDMYGHCSTSVVVEPMPFEVEEYIVPGSGMAKQADLNEYNDVKPKNDYSVAEKLQIALEMAESIADLHGYKGGVIVHDDVQLCQWLRNSEGKLKLGDFNRAEAMEWRETNSSYCKYKNGKVYGNYRSPEEVRDDYLDEQIDVYSFGNNIYGLLTGLWVFYDTDDDQVVQGKVSDGQRAYIDDRYRNRSYAEGKLVELMERCWVEDPAKRADIFEAVRFLREAVEENKKVHE